MNNAEGEPPAGQPKRARQENPLSFDNNINLSPSARLHDMTLERIDSLEADKTELKAEVAQLMPHVAEAARLEEALGVAELIDVLATVLIGVGGFLVSYATFNGKTAQSWANFAGGCLSSGVVMLLGQSIRR